MTAQEAIVLPEEDFSTAQVKAEAKGGEEAAAKDLAEEEIAYNFSINIIYL